MIQVSVIIPTMNRAQLLPRAIQSVLAQEGVSFELIVADDGSTDETRQVIEKEFPSVIYLYQANQGPAAARNRGMEASKGRWIAFLDSDDEWKPGKLKTQLAYFEQNPDSPICQTEEIWIRKGRRVNPMNKHKKVGGWIFEKCLPLCIVSPSAVMIHRSVFEKVGLFDETYPACEDYELWLRIAAQFPIGLIEKAYVVKYGGHEDQLSHRIPALDGYRIRALVKVLQSGKLSPEQERAAKKMLEEKSRIYVAGALKRGKTAEAEEILGHLKQHVKNPS